MIVEAITGFRFCFREVRVIVPVSYITPSFSSPNVRFNDEWCRIMGCIYDLGMEEEICAVHRAFRAYKSLGLEGFMIKLDGKIIAYTLGEPFRPDTYLVHVEKAFPQYRGAYQVINQLMVKYVMETYPGVKYINREDDAGDKGLRHAKMSYRPVMLLEKHMTKITPPTKP